MLVFPHLYNEGLSFSTNGRHLYPKIVVVPSFVTSITNTYDSFKGHSEIDEIYFLEGSSITSFPEEAFNGCTDLTKIIFPENLSSIGKNCFINCSNLYELDNIPSSVNTFGESAFSGSKLTKINFPKNLTTIGANCFLNSANLSEIRFEDDCKFSIGNHAFDNCDSISDDLVNEILSRATSVGEYSFANRNIEPGENGVLIPIISNYMFYNNDFLEKAFLSGTQFTGDTGRNAFENCSSLNDFTFDIEQLNNRVIIPTQFFKSCTMLKNIELPHNLTEIKVEAFRAAGLEEITLPNTLKNLYRGAFANCTNLTEITIPDNGVNIGNGCFYNCSNLQKINIPDGLSSIFFDRYSDGGYVYDNNGRSTYLYYGHTFAKTAVRELDFSNALLVTIPNYCFKDCPNLISLKFPSHRLSIREGAFADIPQGGDLFLNLIDFGDESDTARYTFRNSGFTNITIHNFSRRSYFGNSSDYQAFGNTKKLQTLQFDDNCGTNMCIRYYAFDNCGARRIILPKNTYWDSSYYTSYGVFRWCTNVIEYKLPENMPYISSYCFEGNYALEEIHLPDSIKNIYNRAFWGDGNLKRIYIGSGINEASKITNEAFLSMYNLRDIYFNIPKNNAFAIPSNVWGAGNSNQVRVHWKIRDVNWTSNKDNTLVFFDNIDTTYSSPLQTDTIGEMQYKAYHRDFVSVSGTVNINTDESITNSFNIEFIENENAIKFAVQCNIPEAKVSIKQDGNHISSEYITVLPNTEISYSIELDGFPPIIRTLSPTENTTVTITEEDFSHNFILKGTKLETDNDYTLSFDNCANFIQSIIQDRVFIIKDNGIQSYRNCQSPLYIDAYSYLKISVNNIPQTLNIKGHCQVYYSNSSYAIGAIYVGTKKYNPSYDQLKSLATDGTGRYIMHEYNTTIDANHTMILQPNTTYYINFIYKKKSNYQSTSYQDYLSISEISCIENIEEEENL